MDSQKKQKQQITKKDLRKVFWRSFTLQGSFTYERMQALGYLYSLIPILMKIYPKKRDRAEAYQRHLAFFNTTPAISSFIMGISGAMEQRNAKDRENFDPSSINSIKVALMGPFAGIGDSFFWGTFRVVSAGIGISLANQGNILGPILFLLLFNIPHFLARYHGTFIGFNKGTDLLNTMQEKGQFERLSFSASVLGLIVIGAMTGTLIDLTTPLEFNMEGAEVSIQETLDEILPKLLPLSLTLFMLYLLKRNVKVNYIMLSIIVVGVLTSALGIF
ncbi:PTS system mannose/fructose/sorbose family transporter subunit IID [Alteribacillus sp. YIM 98480]|uniref:PTS system mannose/fructose/sorbose family transporter subunit IID n=1 Tax=Alteribacillus sp. YIM 98480 TaxID=2606599 RepID=UPI00131BC735|nr:PTS system mannose/fructose/sorbose family transporter subunit IID [Alteribacillus sp. YIM 98480]